MPILLKEFIATHVEGHGLAVDALIEKFHREPPIAQDTIGSPFYDEHYKQQITHPDYNRLNYSVQNKVHPIVKTTILKKFMRSWFVKIINQNSCYCACGYVGERPVSVGQVVGNASFCVIHDLSIRSVGHWLFR